MKITTAAGLVLCSATLLAQENTEMATWMKTLAATNGAMRKHMEAKETADVTMEARKIAEIYQQVGAYFAKVNAEDAVGFAKTGQDAATDLSSAATSGDMDKAAADMKAIGGTCGPCHSAHREKVEGGGYKIK